MGRNVNHPRWKLARERRIIGGHAEPPEVVAERRQIRLAMALVQLIYDRRTALGLTEVHWPHGPGRANRTSTPLRAPATYRRLRCWHSSRAAWRRPW